MLQFYIVWQRCLLDMPYHTYHLLLISGLPGPVRSWLKFISKELRGGLSFTAEAWRRRRRRWQQQQQQRGGMELSQSRPGKITFKFQWHNGQNQSSSQQSLSLPRELRDVGLVQERGRKLPRDHTHSSSVSLCGERMPQISDSPVDGRESRGEGFLGVAFLQCWSLYEWGQNNKIIKSQKPK